MARVTYRSRRPASARVPSQLIVVPREPALLHPSTEQQQYALWVQARHDELTAVRDQEALAGLADGHTEAFLDYAKDRVGKATDPAERDYWNSLITRATQKLGDDTIAAKVNSGEASLEDLYGHIAARLGGLAGGQSNPNYPALLNQLATVKNSMAARDFRNEMLTAQEDYINNPDKTQAKADYARKLNEMLYRAKDPTAQQTLLGQLKDVRTAIEQDKTLARDRQVAEKVALYHDHKLSASDLQSFLATQAETATSSAEASRYATLAQQVETNERTRTSAAVSAAARAGATALRDALFGPEQNYLDAKAALTASLDRGVPSIEAVNIFKTAAAAYDAAIVSAAPHTAGTQLTTLLGDRRTIETTQSELTKQTANKVVAEVQKRGAAYQTMIDTNKAGTNDPEQESQSRFLWAQALRDAIHSPLVSGQQDQIDTLSRDLEKVTRDQAKEIAASSAILAGQKPTKALATALPGLYKTYADGVAAGGGTPLSLQDWSQGLALGNLDRASAQATRADLQQQLGSADPNEADSIQKQIAILDAVVSGDQKGAYSAIRRLIGAPVDGRTLLDFRRVRDQHNAEIDAETQRLIALTSGRGRDGSTAASPTNLYAPGGLLDESTRAAATAGEFGTATPNAGPPGPWDAGGFLDESARAARRAADAQMTASGGRGPGMQAPPPSADETPPQGAYGANDGLPVDPRIRSLQTHFDASTSLDQPAPIALPAWEIPPLPPEPAFDGPQITAGEANYAPPPLDFGGALDLSTVPLPPWAESPNPYSGSEGPMPAEPPAGPPPAPPATPEPTFGQPGPF